MPNDTNNTGLPAGSTTILLVDDELNIREAVQRILERAKFTVLAAATGEEALKVFQQHQSSIEILLADIVLGTGMNGFELAGRLLLENSAVKVIFMSGYSQYQVMKDRGTAAGASFLSKPFDSQQLIQCVQSLSQGVE